MTGIERLRELSKGMHNHRVTVWQLTDDAYEERFGVTKHGPTIKNFLSDIADQIEREQEAMVADSPYDAILPEDREAIAWVREHGGLERVKNLLDWVLGPCSTKQQLDFDFWLSGRVMHELGFEEDIADRDEVERRLLARLMPEGMEWLVEAWPRFEDDAPVSIGDQFAEHGGCENVVDSVEVGDCWFKIHGFDGAAPRYSKRASVKHPAPKVLDADGVEIRVVDTVYLLPGDWCDEFPCLGYHGGEKLVVFSLHADHVRGGIGCRDTRSPKDICYPQPSQLTHRAPVLAADGRPLREGETVWVTRDRPCDAPLDKGDEVTVRHAYPKTVSVKDETGDQWIVHADHLTHECPDSWERLEKDANAAVCIYFGASVKDCENCDHNSWKCSYDKSRDLVRRARALAGDA